MIVCWLGEGCPVLHVCVMGWMGVWVCMSASVYMCVVCERMGV